MKAWWPWWKRKLQSLFDPAYRYDPEAPLLALPLDTVLDQPHPKNAPGPFYVINHECIICGAPHAVASDLMAWDNDETGPCHCYFKKQPETPAELEQAIDAIKASCCGAVVYSGDDAYVLRELRRGGCGDAIVRPRKP